MAEKVPIHQTNLRLTFELYRHAAELATAKKKSQNMNGTELSTQDDDDYSSDEEMNEKMLKAKDTSHYIHPTSLRMSQS